MSNQLKNATSPYLLQHAENPVNWYPWCEEAFEKAKSEDKPIFLSIGYSTCHWYHVMAHESFEDEKTAEILNQYFISIKVDREERPDIDSVYMTVCQAFTGNGGWSMSIFMTWDKKPFFAGTYFPPKSHYGMPGFPDLLNTIASQWNNSRKELLQSAEQIISHLKNEKSNNRNASNENLIKQAIVTLPGSLAMAIISPFAGRIYDKLGIKRLFVVGSAVMLISNIGMFLIGMNTPLAVASLLNVIRCISIGCLMMPLVTWGMSKISGNTAHGTALLTSLRTIAGAIGSAVFVGIMTIVGERSTPIHGLNITFISMAMVSFIMLLISLFGVKENKK